MFIEIGLLVYVLVYFLTDEESRGKKLLFCARFFGLHI